MSYFSDDVFCFPCENLALLATLHKAVKLMRQLLQTTTTQPDYQYVNKQLALALNVRHHTFVSNKG